MILDISFTIARSHIFRFSRERIVTTRLLEISNQFTACISYLIELGKIILDMSLHHRYEQDSLGTGKEVFFTGKEVGEVGLRVSFGNVRITDLDFADDAVIFAETTKILAGALDSLSEEAEPLGLRVPWIKT